MKIWVHLPEELVSVWRSVDAQHLDGNIYLILDQPYDRATESWQFEPGQTVYCEYIELERGLTLVAARPAPSPSHS